VRVATQACADYQSDRRSESGGLTPRGSETAALAARAYFVLCLALGRTLRSATYSTVRIVHQDGQRLVRKHRRFYAPFLIWMSGLLVRVLDTGVRVLPQREWEQRERRIYGSLYGTSIGVDAGGVLVLPYLAGHTLATLLEDPERGESIRKRAIELATVGLAEFHRQGFTHADAMAENGPVPARRLTRSGTLVAKMRPGASPAYPTASVPIRRVDAARTMSLLMGCAS